MIKFFVESIFGVNICRSAYFFYKFVLQEIQEIKETQLKIDNSQIIKIFFIILEKMDDIDKAGLKLE